MSSLPVVKMDTSSRAFASRILAVMDRKNHWAYSALAEGRLRREQLLVHFQHEYRVYVRDFPVLLARALGHVPPILAVRKSLAENIYEEQTGGLSHSGPHPELFLRMMEGLGFGSKLFDESASELHPAAARYRDYLLDVSAKGPWQLGVAVLTIFVEGSVNERAELNGTFKRAGGEDAIRKHPLVAHYGCPMQAMSLSKAHAAIEGDHRKDAWRILFENVEDGPMGNDVAAEIERAFELWWAYRDGVAQRMGIERSSMA